MRLTEKTRNEIDTYILKDRINKVIDLGNAVIKLGELEDVEEELGINLITLFKALKNGICFKTKNGQIIRENVHIYDFSLTNNHKINWCFITEFSKEIIYFKDYKIIWSLSKKELEK